MKIVLVPESFVETEKLCSELREIARKKAGYSSSTVCMVEWIAADTIEVMARELRQQILVP